MERDRIAGKRDRALRRTILPRDNYPGDKTQISGLIWLPVQPASLIL
ncbi:hypothetical protein RMSM_03816 [Rhodopirellula maiorica SM1]|uniref:Uncharacterized protein n=1 Tax=Rhodopirellula maiorica SM1 TaxID=1265738 RepID=M5RIW3_9BACT|nr:hypothetical protein RMSM_03816 [Rhodopirellula maiorica SM1]